MFTQGQRVRIKPIETFPHVFILEGATGIIEDIDKSDREHMPNYFVRLDDGGVAWFFFSDLEAI